MGQREELMSGISRQHCSSHQDEGTIVKEIPMRTYLYSNANCGILRISYAESGIEQTLEMVIEGSTSAIEVLEMFRNADSEFKNVKKRMAIRESLDKPICIGGFKHSMDESPLWRFDRRLTL